MLKKFITLIVVSSGLGFLCGHIGFSLHQATAIAIFCASILGTLFFWDFRLSFAFLGVSILLITRTINLENVVRFASLEVILFLVGMMVLVGLMKDAGFFAWLVSLILRIKNLTAHKFLISISVISALLACAVDEVTSIIFIVAAIFEICDYFEVNPTPFLIISVLASKEDNTYSIELIQKTFKDFHDINSRIAGDGDIQISYIGLEEQDHIINNLCDEGYLLRISNNKIELKANTPKGIYYAAMSLVQMLEKAEGKLPAIEIIDWPDMKIRGISDDISRGQVSNLENFKKIITHIARYKMNTYMPYMEDMLVFEKYPTIGKDRGALTKSEVKEIIDFAKKNFVEVIPIFQTLGHYENILSQEEFLKYAEFPGAASLNVSNDSTYVFLENLLKEVGIGFKKLELGKEENL